MALALGGCAIHQRVDPVPRMEGRELCVIENPNVRESFLQEYRRALEEKGFQVKVLDKTADVNDCELTSTYTANWRWDLALYMAFAKLTVYSGGSQVGSALYDSLSGGGNIAKFISAENKIRELVGQLFPK
jgi:hypothetical protein